MLKKLLRSFFSRAGGKLLRIADRFKEKPQPDPAAERASSWFRDQGDKTHRVQYPLNGDSVVFDIGGFEGNWAADIFTRYACHIHVFEPVQEFADQIKTRFCGNRKVRVNAFGLSGSDQTIDMYVKQDGSSVLRPGGEVKRIELRQAMEYIHNNKIIFIDLMKINIEGGEYDLLEHLLDEGFATSVGNFQIQFHDFIPEAEKRMHAIQERLRQTHELTYQYPFVWENWALKKRGE